ISSEDVPADYFKQMWEANPLFKGKKSPDELFDDIIGVTFPDPKAKPGVELSFSARYAPYFKSKPWYHPYQIEEENETEFRVSLFIKPNQELKSLILSLGPDVKVVKPESLRKEISDLLTAASEYYL